MRTVTRNNPENVATEDYLSKIMKWILLCDNNRIKCTVSGVSMSKEVSINEIIDKDRNTLIKDIVDQRIEGLFYASPQKQLEYFEHTLGIKVDEEVWGKWIEIKARRDLWIHNAGIVNKIYLAKAGIYSLCNFEKEATIDLKFFADSVAILKR